MNNVTMNSFAARAITGICNWVPFANGTADLFGKAVQLTKIKSDYAIGETRQNALNVSSLIDERDYVADVFDIPKDEALILVKSLSGTVKRIDEIGGRIINRIVIAHYVPTMSDKLGNPYRGVSSALCATVPSLKWLASRRVADFASMQMPVFIEKYGDYVDKDINGGLPYSFYKEFVTKKQKALERSFFRSTIELASAEDICKELLTAPEPETTQPDSTQIEQVPSKPSIAQISNKDRAMKEFFDEKVYGNPLLPPERINALVDGAKLNRNGVRQMRDLYERGRIVSFSFEYAGPGNKNPQFVLVTDEYIYRYSSQLDYGEKKKRPH